MKHIFRNLLLLVALVGLLPLSVMAMTKGNTVNLTQAIQYSDQGFSKKPIFKGDAYTILLFAFKKGQQLHAHTIPIDAFIQVLEGTATVIIADKEFEVAAGEKIDLPKNLPHALTAKENFKMLLVK